MQAVTFQAPGEVRLEERPEPELVERDDAIVRVEATGVCGSDLHIYHGRVEIEPGFTLGHEYVGTVVAAGEAGAAVGGGGLGLGHLRTAAAPTAPAAASASSAPAAPSTSATSPASSATARPSGRCRGPRPISPSC